MNYKDLPRYRVGFSYRCNRLLRHRGCFPREFVALRTAPLPCRVLKFAENDPLPG